MSENDEDAAGHEPTERDLAACALTVELIRSGRVISYVGDILVERVDETEHPDEPPESVVIRRFCELVVPALAEDEPAEALWNAAQLIDRIRDRIVADLELELDAEQRRN